MLVDSICDVLRGLKCGKDYKPVSYRSCERSFYHWKKSIETKIRIYILNKREKIGHLDKQTSESSEFRNSSV